MAPGGPPPFDVAVVGYGPVGATLANLLGQLGLSVAVLDREGEVHRFPRAASLDAEAMRVLQAAGLAEEVARSACPASGMRFVNADGKLLLHWQRTAPTEEGWHQAWRFHQPELEAVLRRGVARFPRVRPILRAEFTGLPSGPDRPGAATVSYRALDEGTEHTLAARYVVGCDGGRSPVRRSIGSTLIDLGPRERWVVLDVLLHDPPQDDAPGRAATVPADAVPPPMLGDSVQHCDPRRPATFIPMVGARRRWEFMLMPGDDPAGIVAPARLWELLRPWGIGPGAATIERAVVYTFHAAVASDWRRGRVLLAGDAAHQMPPFLGQGLCAGLRDAANLAWKLALADTVADPDRLLDSYQSERAPHVREVIALAVRLGGLIQTTDPAQADARDRRMLEAPETMRIAVPPLGPGLGGETELAGTRAAQPVLADGQRLDDHVGYRFAVLGTPGILGAVRPATAERWHRADARVLPVADGAAADWLTRIGHPAVIVRPDRAILATADTPSELDTVSGLIPLPARSAAATASPACPRLDRAVAGG